MERYWKSSAHCKRQISEQLSLQEPLKNDTQKEIHEAIFKGDHKTIIAIFSHPEKEVTLRCCYEEPETGERKTMMRKLLKEATNGNKIVENILNSYIRPSCDNEDSVNYNIELDFNGISDKNSNQQMICIYDLLDLKAKNQKHAGALKGKSLFYVCPFMIDLLFFVCRFDKASTIGNIYCLQMEESGAIFLPSVFHIHPLSSILLCVHHLPFQQT